MIFCCTRNSALVTAKSLARIWSLTNPPTRLWKGPQRRLEATNEDLKSELSCLLHSENQKANGEKQLWLLVWHSTTQA